jgi:hypothetical protein
MRVQPLLIRPAAHLFVAKADASQGAACLSLTFLEIAPKKFGPEEQPHKSWILQ